MPRAAGPKCRRRRTAVDELDRMVEFNLTHGHGFGPWDLHSRVEFARPWAKWRDEITRRWIASHPGSRPAAAYLLGEIEAPPWEKRWRPMRPIRGIDVVLPEHGFHQSSAELEHLDRLGLISDDEWNAAVDRLDGSSPGRCEYQSVADEQEDRHRAAPGDP
jgi:hypothetical protein